MLRALQRLAGGAFLRLAGWQVDAPESMPPRFVLVGAPHTSNWDFVFMMATTWKLGLRIQWLGKHTLFRPPFDRFFRAMGGIPVDRRAPHHMVHTIARRFAEEPELVVAVPPEGTRKKVAWWKSGFYHIAREAGVPIGLGYLDYARRRAGIGNFMEATGNVAADMDRIRAFYRDVRGYDPARQSEPRLREEQPGTS